MSQFHIVLFCLTAEYHKQLSPYLIDNGYKVGPASTQNKVSLSKGITTIIAYEVNCNGIIPVQEFVTCVRKGLDEIKAYYYGYTVISTEVGVGLSITWNVGNIDGETDITRVLQMKALW
jgi:hypothetical protein